MIHLTQKLNTADDSFTYAVLGDDSPAYRVDSHGYVMKDAICIGKFVLRETQWHLVMDGKTFMSGPIQGLHGLPEFELKALTALARRDAMEAAVKEAVENNEFGTPFMQDQKRPSAL